MDLLGFESLDALVAEGVRQAQANRNKAQSSKAQSSNTHALVTPSEKYTNPENWIEGRGIALLHEESQTLLGNFRELLHRTEKGCRRLVREERPIQIDEIELVSGTWGWVAPAVDRSERAPVVFIHQLDLDVVLDFPAVSAACKILVHKQGAGTLRIELLNETTFSDPLGQAFLVLPAGTNILPVLSRETKLIVHVETQEA